MRQLAVSCVGAGYSSPLLMLPVTARAGSRGDDLGRFGYFDLTRFAIGYEELPPTFPSAKFYPGHPTIAVETIGAVRSILRAGWSAQSPSESFNMLARSALAYTGPGPQDFAVAVAARLYGQEVGVALARLSQGDRMRLLRGQLLGLRDTPMNG